MAAAGQTLCSTIHIKGCQGLILLRIMTGSFSILVIHIQVPGRGHYSPLLSHFGMTIGKSRQEVNDDHHQQQDSVMEDIVDHVSQASH